MAALHNSSVSIWREQRDSGSRVRRKSGGMAKNNISSVSDRRNKRAYRGHRGVACAAARILARIARHARCVDDNLYLSML